MPSAERVVSIAENAERATFQGLSEKKFLQPLGIGLVETEEMREQGLLVVSEIMKKKDLTKFEQAILRALHWFSSSQMQVEPENELLNLVTCLEAFFSQDRYAPITLSVTEGVAFILDTTFEGRTFWKNKANDMYGKRSAVSHGGGKIVFERGELEEYRFICREILRIMIARKDEFKDPQSLKIWIDEQKLR